jgi:hypothetical protein
MAWSIDAREWNALGEIFDDPLVVDYVSVFGGQPQTLPGHEFAAYLGTVLDRFAGTQHLVTNHRAWATTAGALCVSQVQATHAGAGAAAGARWTGSGSYRIELRRTPEAWRIFHYIFTVSWAAGDRDLMRTARRAPAPTIP